MSSLTTIQELTPAQVDLIKSTVAKGATADELKLFLYRCRQMGLDPLKPGQIHFVKYGTNPGVIVIGIHGFRSKAASTGKHTGTKRGIIRDDTGACVGAWCEVYRSDWAHPARDEISMQEYNTGKAQWAKMPETMIKKVAEASALRIAFPDELGGIYSDDEMGQAMVSPSDLKEANHPTGYAESIENDLGKFIPSFGRFKEYQLNEIPRGELEKYLKWLQEKSKEKNEPLVGQTAEFVEIASAYLRST